MEGLRVSSVSLSRFRNHREWSSELDPGLTVLVGRNAAGKTNILEAIMVTATGTSFRSFVWEDLVMRGEQEVRVSIMSSRGGTPTEIDLRITDQGVREHSVNGTRKRKMAEIVGRIPLVSFVPEDLSMSKGSSEKRRAPLDALGDRLSSAYSALRVEYARLVRQRNALLRQRAAVRDLEPWDDMLASVGSSLTMHRLRLLARMKAPAIAAYERVSGGETLGVGYLASWIDGSAAGIDEIAGMSREEIEDAIGQSLRGGLERERDRGMTLSGPHRDDVVLSIGGHPARAYASQGQHRTVALAWKMAEVDVVHEVTGVRPLLLLDDVMSELDSRRRAELSSYVLEGSQSILTTTNLSYFTDDMLGAATVVELGRG
ncbi:MAG: DNA replication/repair protein RecF [Anaerosomatales bacterium]|nr:DNA replication/repair protein RecF [Anaerosomatales bacterium]MDT8433717.1 DNA replication/repair protein RecF [Anaerosomatales bacterium]